MSTSPELQHALELHQQGDFSTAILLYDQLLRSRRDAMTLQLRGLAEHHRGNHREALPFLKEALRQPNPTAKLHLNTGNVYKALGNLQPAENHFLQATKINPALCDSWKSLAETQAGLNKEILAIESLHKALQIEPGEVSCHRLLGKIFAKTGQLDEAVTSYLRVLELGAETPAVLNELGSLYRVMGKLKEAVELFQRATQIDVRQPGLWCNYGATLHELKRLTEAEKALKQAVRLHPQFAGAHYNLGNLYRDCHRNDQAIEHYQKAVEWAPDSTDFRLNYVSMLNTVGRFEESAVQCRELIRIDPNFAPAYYNLFTFNSDHVTEHEVAELERLLHNEELDEIARANAFFSLGKRSDRLGLYSEAFAHFEKANQLTPRRLNFDEGRLKSLVDQMIAAFPAHANPSHQFRGSKTTQPIFILGMPRSGSTLIDQILTSHSHVQGAGEFDGIRHLIQNFLERPFRQEGQNEKAYPGCLSELSQSYLEEMAQVYLQRLVATAGEAKRITDKMPNNAFQLGLISMLFPEATIIYTQRDPRDIGLSCYFQNFTAYHEFSFDLKNIGIFYREHLRLMEHWHHVLPITIHEVVYEELVSNQVTETHRLVEEICGLPWEESCLQFHQNERAVHTASLWQVRQPIYQQSVQKWKQYEKYIGPLLETLPVDTQRFDSPLSQ
ncbi:tetratricopeptide repeat-containing sulfotransferase family protein [Rubinisphaera italica]|uniref:Lipoprotein NlpI n=1 Tax=Rubinisphaera italica TaxID=2527969 RepID=A0A5C5XQV5_9PLAN|nr:tetratricopeptide repeat-containing sulfotransferase family protein [Rubinisphaera italica]TWT64112.1 lipoprotein NlpI [Rubinisphaera italica]